MPSAYDIVFDKDFEKDEQSRTNSIQFYLAKILERLDKILALLKNQKP